MGASACTRPFVVAELVIASKKMIEKRTEEYKSLQRREDFAEEEDINNLHCDFKTLDNTAADL